MKGRVGLGSEPAHYSEYGNCALIGDDTAGLIVAIDYGPRVMSYFLEGGQNVLFNKGDPNNGSLQGAATSPVM